MSLVLPPIVAVFPSQGASASNQHVACFNRLWLKAGANLVDGDFETLLQKQCQIVHFHWFEGFTDRRNPVRLVYRCRRLLALLKRQKSRGAKVLYHVHDLVGHDTPHRWLERWFLVRFMRLVDQAVFFSNSSRERGLAMYPSLRDRCQVIPLGDYRGMYPDDVSRGEARKRLGVGNSMRIIVHLGLVKPYKNVDGLMRAFREIPGDWKLMVAGKVPDAGYLALLEDLASADERVDFRPGFVADEDLQIYLRAADVSVHPYHEILNSGSALLALTFDCPVVVPALGSMPELQELVSPEWVLTYPGGFDRDTLAAALEWVGLDGRGETAPLERVGWDTIGAQTLALYRELIG